MASWLDQFNSPVDTSPFSSRPSRPKPWGAMPQFFRDRFSNIFGNAQPQPPQAQNVMPQFFRDRFSAFNVGSPQPPAPVAPASGGFQPPSPLNDLMAGLTKPSGLDLNAEYERIKAEQGAGAAREWMRQQQG